MGSKTTGKRIVSKAEYVKAQATRLGWVCSGILTFIVVSVCMLLFIVPLMQNDHGVLNKRGEYTCSTSTMIIVFIVVGFSLYLTAKMQDCITEKFVNIDPGVPLTHANAANLLAPDSLVRASSEPIQEQQTVLLRAVAAEQQTPPEQLVRASSGQVDSL